MTTQAKSILEKAVPLRLAFQSIGTRKQVGARQVGEDDSEATLRAAVETGVATEADASLVNASKRTIDCAELREISRIDNVIRKKVENFSVRSEADMPGIYMIPLKLVEKTNAALFELRDKREAAVKAFIAVYPAAKKAAQERLNGLFNEADYPPVEDVAERFSFSWRYVDMLAPANLASVSVALYEEEKAKAKEHWEQASREVEMALRTSFAEMVAHLAEQMNPGTGEGGKGKRVLHERAIEKFRNFLDLFAAKNLTDDNELDTLVTEAKGLIEGVSAATLRKEPNFKEAIRLGFQDLEQRVKPLLVKKPSRAIVFAPAPTAGGEAAVA